MGTATHSRVRVLNIVETLFIRFPDLYPCPGKRTALGASDGSLNPARLTGCAASDITANIDHGSVVCEKGAEDCCLSCVAKRFVVDGNRLHRGAEHIGEQHELLPLLIGDMAGSSQKVDRGPPFLFRQTHFADE